MSKKVFGLSLATTDRELNGQIQAVATTGAAFADAVHLAMCSSIQKVQQECEDGNPNVNRFRDILLNMPKGTRRVAASDWLKKVAPVSVTWDKGKNDVSVKMLKGKARAKHKGFQLEFACKNPFWEVEKPESTPQPITAMGVLMMAQKKLSNALQGKGKAKLADDPEVVEATIAGLDAVISDLKKSGATVTA